MQQLNKYKNLPKSNPGSLSYFILKDIRPNPISHAFKTPKSDCDRQ